MKYKLRYEVDFEAVDDLEARSIATRISDEVVPSLVAACNDDEDEKGPQLRFKLQRVHSNKPPSPISIAGTSTCLKEDTTQE